MFLIHTYAAPYVYGSFEKKIGNVGSITRTPHLIAMTKCIQVNELNVNWSNFNINRSCWPFLISYMHSYTDMKGD